MELPQEDFDRLIIIEHARKTAEANYLRNPLDADNLTKWGGALLELSQFQTIPESKAMLIDSVSKLEEALTVDPKKHDTLWCLGNSLTSLAFTTSDPDEAKVYFDKAHDSFKKAADEDPSNDLYIKSLEVSVKAPAFHSEIHTHAFPEDITGSPGGGSSASATAASNPKSSKKKISSDLKYDIFGWIILAVGIVALVGMTKSHIPPSSSR